MARKKIILFIVEGINDKTCLEGVLEKILDSEEVRFQITEGDITTRLALTSTKYGMRLVKQSRHSRISII